MAKPAQKYRANARKIYEKHHGVKVPQGIEVHHTLPRRLGGTDDPSNLELLTQAEHKAAHLKLYEEYGDFRDLCAYHMIGSNFSEAQMVAASNGGKAAAKMFKDTGRPQGFQFFEPEQMRQAASAGGKVGGAKQHAMGLGIHAQTPEERLVLASAGGTKGCLTNGWKDSATQAENGKKGGPKNKGFRWYHYGQKAYKYTAKQQEAVPFDDFLRCSGFSKGRPPEKETMCPHCGKTGTRIALLRGHFNNCKALIK